MATLEERMARVEHDITRVDHENAELKRAVDLMNTALGALVNKSSLEKINEQNSKTFDTLIRHDQFTNQQLAELRGQLTEQDGKIVGMQTEMRQRFEQQGGQIIGLQAEMRQGLAEVRQEMHQGLAEVKQDTSNQILGLQAEMRQSFEQLEKLLLDRLPPTQ